MKVEDLQTLNDLLTATRERGVIWQRGHRDGAYRLLRNDQNDDYQFGYVALATSKGLGLGPSYYFGQAGPQGSETRWLNRFSDEGRLVTEICRLAELQIQEKEKGPPPPGRDVGL